MEKNSKATNSFFEAAAKIVGQSYAELGQESLRSSEKRMTDLLNQRCIPKDPFDRLTIEMLLNKIALMDYNNYEGNCGVGEREGRIFSSIV